MSRALLAGSLSNRELTKALVGGELSAEQVREVPAQAIYIAIQHAGLEAARSILPMLSAEQYKALLDFEFWTGDRVNEDKLWSYLSTVDEEKSLEPMGQFLDNVDHELLAMIMARYVEAQTYEEPTDEPPGKFWHSPDKGFTWIHFKTEDPERYRLLGRLMAIIFAAQPELFYQLIAMPMSATPSELEENSYQLRIRRLADIGIPEHNQSSEVNAPLDAELIVEDLRSAVPAKHWARRGIVALAEGAESLEPLSSMMAEVFESASVEEAQVAQDELTYLVNCSIVHFAIPFHEQSLINLHIQRVHGAINIGVQRVQELSDASLGDIFSHLGFVKLYRIGLAELGTLREAANNISRQIDKITAEPETDQAADAVLACAREVFPVLPMFFTSQGFLSDEEGKLPGGVKPAASLSEIRAAKALLIEEFAS